MCVWLIGIVAFDMEMGVTCFSEDLFLPSEKGESMCNAIKFHDKCVKKGKHSHCSKLFTCRFVDWIVYDKLVH